MEPEFSRRIAIEGITPDKVRKETIEATEEECAALAKRFDLRELSGFKAALSIHRIDGGVVRLSGHFEAEVVQGCVVSLLDVPAEIAADFETFFSEDSHRLDDEDVDLYLDEEDVPEAIVNGVIDLGEIVAQYLSLELEPYPRAPGVSLAAQLTETGVEVKNSPFSVLQDLQRNQNAQSGGPVSKGLGAVKSSKPKKQRKKKAK